MKKLILTVIILIMTFSLLGCGNNGNSSGESTPSESSGSSGTETSSSEEKTDIKLEGDVAKVDDEIITAEVVTEYMTLFAFTQDSSLADVTNDETMSYVMEMVLENMTEQKVLAHYIENAGVNILEDPVRKMEFEDFKSRVLEDTEMAKLYEAGEITDEGIDFIFKTQYLSQDFYSLMKEQKNYSEDELKRYYNDHQGDMQRTIVDAAHIMVTDLELAKDIRNKLVNDGADFAELAAEYSVDSNTKAEGGELGEFGKNETLPAFEEAVFAMEIGEISEPVLTDLGYHIIKLNNKYQKLLDFEVCRNYIEDLLVSNDCSVTLKELKETTIEYLYK